MKKESSRESNLITQHGVFLFAVHSIVFAQTAESAAELKRFQGVWNVVELVENGQVISSEAIKKVLPSGGAARIVSNTIQFTSPATKVRVAKAFSVDATTHPKTIEVSAMNTPEGWGIYRFEGERLVLCMADPSLAQRPTDFSSRPGSQHMLMVLERAGIAKSGSLPSANTNSSANIVPIPSGPAVPRPPAVPPIPSIPASAPGPAATPPPPTAATARVLTDAEVTTMLRGSWRLNDGAGVLQVSFDPTGSYRSYREVQNPNTFYKVFVQAPVAAGTWNVQSGQLAIHVTSSTDLNRVNRTFYVAVRSVSATDLIFVDSLGRVGKAVKLH